MTRGAQPFADYVKERIEEHPEWEESYKEMIAHVQREQAKKEMEK